MWVYTQYYNNMYMTVIYVAREHRYRIFNQYIFFSVRDLIDNDNTISYSYLSYGYANIHIHTHTQRNR